MNYVVLVALQVYSVRDFAEKDLKGTLEKIKMGYDGVEFAVFTEIRQAKLKMVQRQDL